MSDQTKYSRKLKDAKVLIIGGSSGIGFGVAEACLEAGALVIISSSSQMKVDSKVAILKKSYPSAESRIIGHVCDLGSLENLESNIKRLLGAVGIVDHIVYTAGDSLKASKISEIDVSSITNAGTVRFYAPLILAKYAPQYLAGGPRSSITLTTGAVAEKPVPNWAVIGSFAAGLGGMTRGLALDLQPIRVNLVSPGAVDTELWKMSAEEKEQIFKVQAKSFFTGRIGRVEDVAESYIYLMKDENITGAIISTSGGTTLSGFS